MAGYCIACRTETVYYVGGRRYKCIKCQRSFTYSQMRSTHTGRKPKCKEERRDG